VKKGYCLCVLWVSHKTLQIWIRPRTPMPCHQKKKAIKRSIPTGGPRRAAEKFPQILTVKKIANKGEEKGVKSILLDKPGEPHAD